MREGKTHPLSPFGLTFRHSFRGLRLYRFNGRKASLFENGREYRLLCLILAAVLLSKGETIASLIALEMGSTEYHSLHHHALYASGLVLLLLVALIHLLVKMGERPRTSKFTSRAGSPDPITAKFTSRAGSPNPITAKSLSVYSVENREEATPHLLATGKRAVSFPPSPVLWPFPLRLWSFQDCQAFLPPFSWSFMQRKAEKKRACTSLFTCSPAFLPLCWDSFPTAYLYTN